MKINDAIPVRFQAELEIGDERSPVVVRLLGRDGMSAELKSAVAARLSPGQEVALICPIPDRAGSLRWQGRVSEVGAAGARESEREQDVPIELLSASSETESANSLDVLRRAFSGAILLVGFSDSEVDVLAGRLAGSEFEVLVANGVDEAVHALGQRELAVLCTGADLVPDRALELLGRVAPLPYLSPSQEENKAEVPESQVAEFARSVHIVLAAGSDPTIFQDYIDADQLYYLAQKAPPVEDILNILQSAVDQYRAAHSGDGQAMFSEEKQVETQRVLQVVRLLGGETSAVNAAELIGRAAQDLLQGDYGECLLYDTSNETLWNRRGSGEERRESAAAGVVSFVLRTGQPVRLERVGEDPRYDPEADNDSRSPDERFVAVPVLEPRSTGARGRARVLAVLVASRPADGEAFTADEMTRLHFLADQVAPVLSRLLLQAALDAMATGRDAEYVAVFRQEALEHHTRGYAAQGHVLEISPRWTEWAFRILLLVLLVGVLYTVFGTIHEYASGLAVVKIDDRAEVTATQAGTVTAVAVEPGQEVEEGQVLVRFYGAQEAADLARVEREFELGLADRLRNPADLGAERALGTLRAQKTLAESRLEERILRAPRAGMVSDLRIRPGQHLNLGQTVLSLVDQNPELAIVGLLPGNFRPLVKAGMPLRLELQNYAYAYQHLKVERVDAEVIGPAEARRVLGAGIGDAVPIAGSVVLVHARLPSRTFESDGEIYAFHDGMLGNAEVRVRSEPILVTLIPGLKAVFSDRHE